MPIKLVNLKGVLKDIDKVKKKAIEIIQEETEATAKDIELNAKQEAPVDQGKLRQNITSFEIGLFKWKVLTNSFGNAHYSAYMEFGTGGLVEVPEELKDQAIKFKGKGVKRIDLRPRPYLYPAFVQGRRKYINTLKKELKKLKL